MWLRLAALVFTLQCAASITHFFTPDELRYTFGVTEQAKVPTHEEVFPELEYSEDGELNRIRVQLFGKWHNITLEPATSKLLADFVTAVVKDDRKGGQLQFNQEVNHCHYRHLGNGTIAAISNCGGQIKGTIIDENGIHVIHPFPERHAHRSKREANALGVHIVYKRDAIAPKAEENEFCGIDNVVTEEDLYEDETAIFEDVFVTGQQLVQESDLIVELAVFVDETLWRHFSSKYGGAANSKLQDYSLTLLNNIQIMYYQPTASPPLTFKVIRYEVLTSQPRTLAPNLHQYGHAQRYLDLFCKYQRDRGFRDWDHAILLTGYDIHRGAGSRSISGIARLDGMCDPWNTCTLAEGLDFTSAFIGTHELGHSLGMRHDEPYCPSKHIMSSSLGPGKVTWSTCSLRDYHQFLQRLDGRGKNCMRISNIPAKLSIPVGSKPSQIYDANLQCELMHGPGYHQVTPRVDHYDGICYMMWCGQSQFGRIITSHPALEGTFCGPSKWCSLGRCVPWNGQDRQPAPQQFAPAVPSSPSRQDGSWSGWSGTNCNQCYCSPLAGGIGVSISKRTCSNPYPANGGSECTGSSQRAIVCDMSCSTSSKSVDRYIEEKCTQHKRLKNDRDLTGMGSQLTRYPQRACKVFCDTITRGGIRNYRFFGDNLPDGTSCGNDKYCLGGECLSLSCDNRAIIGRDLPCPSESCAIRQPPTQAPQSGAWTTWSQWSQCSVSCGGGYRTRSRACSRPGFCSGTDSEQETCSTEACPRITSTVSSWAGWTEWNSCSVSCGRGSQARYRKCVSPQGNIAFNCPEKNIEVRNCEAGPCSGVGVWATWSGWSGCSTSCGPGTMIRQRECQREPCDGSATERRSCNSATCSQISTSRWTGWSEWSNCSRLCGRGLKTRTRSCTGGQDCPGQSREQEFCNEQECAQDPSEGDWSEWSAWGSCSVACGAGVKRRTRYCRTGNCPGSYKESAICNEQECEAHNAAWGGWGYWSACSETCGYGVRKRVRKCYGSGACGGEAYERQNCFIRACPFRRS
ncbi:unnamed protein product, partial [Mesorhabditis spiculigera]